MWPFIEHQGKVSYKPRIFSLYAFKAVCITIFETLWGNLQNLLGMKLTTGVTLLILPAIDKDIYIFSCHTCWLWN